MFYLYRRRKLGNGTCRAIQQYLKTNHNVGSVILRNDQPTPVFTEDDVLLRWGCTSNVHGPGKILNLGSHIHNTSDKCEFREHLQLTHPNIVPITWFDYDDLNITYPCILRHKFHAQGKHLWFCTDPDQLQDAIFAHAELYHTDDFYISEYIPKVAEYRVCFIQNKVAWIAQKIPANPNAVAWNVAQGGKFINVRWKDWPINVIDAALLAHKEGKLFLSGVDVMVDMDNKPYVLEINSAPSHTSPYRQASVAACLAWCVKNNTWYNLPLNTNYNKYLRHLHPGLLK